MNPRRRKIITRIIVFLLLGAIVNVTVAWALFGLIDRSNFAWGSATWIKNAEPLRWPIDVPEKWPDPQGLRIRSVSGICELFALSELTDVDVVLEDWRVFSTRIGWPALSLESRWAKHENWQGIQFQSPAWQRGAMIAAGMSELDQANFVPMVPIWPGFAINTMFYAAILWPLFFAPGSVRRTLRRRRGLCPACAYPVGTSPVCTECGKPVTSRKEAAPDERAGCDASR